MVSAPHSAPRNTDRVFAIIATLLPVIAILLTVPFVETAAIDDWSYLRTVRDFVETGHIIYNGWATAILGFQILWGALFAKLFGFSFTVVRLSLLPLIAGCGYLLFLTGRYAGLNPLYALFLSATLTLSPVFLPVADSFMTDGTGFFFLLLGLYGCIRLTQATTYRESLSFLLLIALASIAGGSIRQPICLVSVGVLPYVLFRRRNDRQVLVTGLILWLISTALIVLGYRWFEHQPYALSEKLSDSVLSLIKATPYWIPKFLVTIPTTLLITMPLFVAALSVWLPQQRKKLPVILGGTLLLLLLFVILNSPIRQKATALFGPPLWPYLGITLMPDGILWNDIYPWQDEYAPDIAFNVPTVVKYVLITVIYLSYIFVAVTLADWVRNRRISIRTDSAPLTTEGRVVLTTYLAYNICYLPFLPVRLAMVGGTLFDRYLIPLVPLIGIYLLWHIQNLQPKRIPILAGGVMAVFAFYTVAMNHDYYSCGRARLAALTAVEKSGVPRTRISAGFDLDCLTELDAVNYINDPRLKNPPGAYQPEVIPKCAYQVYYYPRVPHVIPQYVVTIGPNRGKASVLQPTRYANVPYSCWLPPFNRQVYTFENVCGPTNTETTPGN